MHSKSLSFISKFLSNPSLNRMRYVRSVHYSLNLMMAKPGIGCMKQRFLSTDISRGIFTKIEKLFIEAEPYQFKAETMKLLDIVAKSLYSDKEVFLRELVSNANDSLEKLRIEQHNNDIQLSSDLQIEIIPNDIDRTLTIKDNGIGMTKQDLITNLGTIAHSGSAEFVKLSKDDPQIIGRFGVGFYSTLMVAEHISVMSKSRKTPNEAWLWKCDGSTSFTLEPCELDNFGTVITLKLKSDCTNYLKKDVVESIVSKYNDFIGFPILLNEKRINNKKPIWLEEPSKITQQEHTSFFREITKTTDEPRYILHYRTDAPLSIRAIFYVPKTSSPLESMLKESSQGVSLYNRKVLITPNASKSLLPSWLGFLKGVVDCEDIPLNLSREILQDNQLISRLKIVLTNRILKFLLDERKKDLENYRTFYEDYSLFLKEAIVRSNDQNTKQSIAQLLLFQRSDNDQYTTLQEYVQRMKNGQTDIYYIASPSRELALHSPYFEAFKQRKQECLIMCDTHDELVVMQLNDFAGKRFRSIEQEADSAKYTDDKILHGDDSSLSNEQSQDMKSWFLNEFKDVIKTVHINTKLNNHPSSITATHLGSLRQYLKSPLAKQHPIDVYKAAALNLEFNPKHPIIKKIYSLRKTDIELSKLLAQQVIDNALVIAGISKDPISVVSRFNELMTKFIDQK